MGLMHCNPPKITQAWAKGHQDEHTKHEDLPLEAQPNADADEEATKHQRQFGNDMSTVPRAHNNTAQLHMRGRTVDSHYKRTMRHAKTAPDLEKCLLERNKWTPSTYDDMDFRSHG